MRNAVFRVLFRCSARRLPVFPIWHSRLAMKRKVNLASMVARPLDTASDWIPIMQQEARSRQYYDGTRFEPNVDEEPNAFWCDADSHQVERWCAEGIGASSQHVLRHGGSKADADDDR